MADRGNFQLASIGDLLWIPLPPERDRNDRETSWREGRAQQAAPLQILNFVTQVFLAAQFGLQIQNQHSQEWLCYLVFAFGAFEEGAEFARARRVAQLA